MAGHPSHRGPAAKDVKLFAASQLPALRAATRDLCWLLDHGYASHSATDLVGNRHNLTSRQRMAVSRCTCSADAVQHRCRLQIPPAELRGRELWLDGYNVLTLLESALSGGVVLLGRDGCCRDIAGVHRRYRKVTETAPVLQMIGETVTGWGVTCCRWWLDKPVSNSGRLKTFISDIATAAGWNMTVELSFNPDKVLWESQQVIATSDGVVLDRCDQWVNLTREIIVERIPQARLVDLLPGGG
ncbi:MAG TPA: DUF434 domain-containing protein [Verrucomicrobiae bacterium]|nr:DUF434 domain-containing protein [Verrucomicrobiae bacterium]